MSTHEKVYKAIREKFEAWLKHRKKKVLIAENTYEAYLRTIDYFLNRLVANKILRLNDLEVAYLEQFIKIKHAKTHKTYALGTQKVRAAALSTFFNWAYQQGYCRIHWGLSYKITHTQKRYYQTQKPKANVVQASILNQKEVNQLLNDTIDADDFNAVRDKAMMTLMLSSGMYTHEICALTEKAIDFKKHVLKVMNKKGEVRSITLDPALYYKPLKQWLKLRKTYLMRQPHPLLFFSARLNPLSQRTLHYIVAGQLEKMGIIKTQKGSDVLRQTAIVMKLRHGSSIEQVKSMMGLNALITLDRYLPLLTYFMN